MLQVTHDINQRLMQLQTLLIRYIPPPPPSSDSSYLLSLDLLSPDYFHPSAHGHQFLAKHVYEQIHKKNDYEQIHQKS